MVIISQSMIMIIIHVRLYIQYCCLLKKFRSNDAGNWWGWASAFFGRNGRAFDFTTHNNNNQSHYNAHRTYWARLMYTSICNSNGMDRCDPFNGPLTRHYSIFCVALHNWYVRIVCGRWHAWVSMTLMRSNTVECISNPLLFMSIRAFAVLFLLYIMEEYWRLQCLSMRR